MAEKTTKKKTTKKKTTKQQKIEAKMDEVEQAAKEYQEEHEPKVNEEYPPIALPCRGYFRKYDRGYNVECLQTALNRIVLADLEIDGIYEDLTMAAVEKFEHEYGGVPNGKFGHEELKIYNKLRGVK